MKIEMGESLFYSWLRHVKECQVVQTNWKPSPSWQLREEEALQAFVSAAAEHFNNKYGYDILGKSTFRQFISQAEIDVMGIHLSGGQTKIYAVDVAFHSAGLNYGKGRADDVISVIKKSLRSAICIKGYFDAFDGEIIFAVPKAGQTVSAEIDPCVADLNAMFAEHQYSCTARVIANDEFNESVMQPILIASDGVADTSELFMRSYQLVKMFGGERRPAAKAAGEPAPDTLRELKIGKIAQTLLRKALEDGEAGENEIAQMQGKAYSKRVFGIDFPLLIPADEAFDSARYYAKPLRIAGRPYRLCSQWYETPANNDRPLLIAWLDAHGAL